MYLQGKSNYEKHPSTIIENHDADVFGGYDAIAKEILGHFKAAGNILSVDCHSAVDAAHLEKQLCRLIKFDRVIHTSEVFDSNETIQKKLAHHVTEDRVFGTVYRGTWNDFMDQDKLSCVQNSLGQDAGDILIIGVGASYIHQGDLLIYADMTIWEAQARYRKGELSNFAVDNLHEDYIRKYKRGYFIDWRLSNRNVQRLFDRFDYYLDTVNREAPVMITRPAFDDGIAQTMAQPFRLVPFFDEGLWGGQWLQEVCDVHDDSLQNIAWSYNLLFQENELNMRLGNLGVNISGYTVAQKAGKDLVGAKGFARFGAEYPIRYDFLDTMDGGNLSLQVHPNQRYMNEVFGMPYTQDESYYYLDCAEDCNIYLGLKDGAKKEELIAALKRAEAGEEAFDDEKFVHKISVQKHQHYHIPAGTVHASGKNGMVLEISTSPCIFTFKLWDWGRVGLDGKPRPIHLEHGFKNIAFERTTEWVQKECAYQPVPITSGDCYRVEKTGLQANQPIETHRIWFSGKYAEATGNETQALILVEGREAIIESPTHAFAPYVIRYAESIVIPAGVSEYTVRPYGESEGRELALLKTFAKV